MHMPAISWSSSSLGTWHLGLLPIPSAVLPNHGGIGPAATIAALMNISLPRLDKLQLAFGQMARYMNPYKSLQLRMIRLSSVQGWLNIFLVRFAVRGESKQIRQLTNASQQ